MQKKNEAVRALFVHGNSMNIVNYVSRHVAGFGTAASKAVSGNEAVVLERILDIIRWAENDSSYCAELYSIIYSYVVLGVFTKL